MLQDIVLSVKLESCYEECSTEEYLVLKFMNSCFGSIFHGMAMIGILAVLDTGRFSDK